MSLISLFVPEILKIYHSDFNGQIKLIRFANDLRLDVDGLTQSGRVMVEIFAVGINNLLPQDFLPQNILMLGLGGGSVVRWLAHRYSKAQITAVEIDPVMIKIARRHFHLDQITNLKITCADAVQFIKTGSQSWDLVLVDCFQGHHTPPALDDPQVLKTLQSQTRYLLLNRLYWDKFKNATDEFIQNISRHFRIRSVFTGSNLVISLHLG